MSFIFFLSIFLCITPLCITCSVASERYYIPLILEMADGFVSYWSNVMTKPDDPSERSHAFAKKMIETPKVVFTKTLKKSRWANTDIAAGDLTDEITKLKSQDSKDIIVYGAASFDSSLIRAGLIRIVKT